MRHGLAALFGAVFVCVAACNQILGADDPMRRQLGEKCTAERDCEDGLLCVMGACAKPAAVGNACSKATDCSDASSYCYLCRCTPCPTPGACPNFTACGRDCGTKCALGQPCGEDADCDLSAGLLCDTARAQCVSQNCKSPDGTFQCGPTTCAKCPPSG